MDNGRIKLTWPQFIWGVSVLLILAGQWYDMRYGLKAVQEALTTVKDQVVSNSTRIWQLEAQVGNQHEATRIDIDTTAEQATKERIRLIHEVRKLQQKIDTIGGNP